MKTICMEKRNLMCKLKLFYAIKTVNNTNKNNYSKCPIEWLDFFNENSPSNMACL